MFTTAPSSAVISAIHADQSRPSASGRVIPSRKPGCGTASGFSRTTSSPAAASTPRLAPAAKPTFSARVTNFASGASSRTTAAVSSEDALSTTTSSSPGPSSASNAGMVRRSSTPLLKATTTIETVFREGWDKTWLKVA